MYVCMYVQRYLNQCSGDLIGFYVINSSDMFRHAQIWLSPVPSGNLAQFAREAMDHLVVSMVPIPFANLGVEDSTVIHIIMKICEVL